MLLYSEDECDTILLLCLPIAISVLAIAGHVLVTIAIVLCFKGLNLWATLSSVVHSFAKVRFSGPSLGLYGRMI
jgi:hypothetical protein